MEKLCILACDMKPPWAEGVKNNMHNIGKRLSKQFDVFYLGFSDKTGISFLEGSRSYTVKSPLFRTKVERWFYPVGAINAVNQAKRILEKEKPDIILSGLESASMGLMARLIRRHCSRAVHVQIVTGDWYSFRRTPPKIFLAEELPHMLFINRRISKMGLSGADRLLATSRYMEKRIEQLGFDNVAYVPNGVDRERFKGDPKQRTKHSEDFVVSYVGHLTYVKGTSLLLKAFVRLHKEADTKLLLATTFGSEEWINRWAKKVSGIELSGIVEPEKLYNSSDVFALPRRRSYGTITYPNVILESMSCGTPPVTSDLPGMSEVVKDGDNGFLCRPDNEEDLFKRLLHLSENMGEVRRAAVRAERSMKAFDWDIIAGMVKREIDAV